MYKILTINPGSTSTKIAVFKEEKELFVVNISHSSEALAKYPSIIDQEQFRFDEISNTLISNGIDIQSLSAVVGRGGLLHPLESGTYAVSASMLTDLRNCNYGAHASNLGAILAVRFAKTAGNIPAFIVDPVVVDELMDIARIGGRADNPRRCIFHALNQKAVAKRFAINHNKNYNDLNLVVAHLGGGISVACHLKGRIVDVNNALDGDGPFSPERAGTMQAGAFAKNIIENQLDIPTVAKMLAGKGGLVSHLGVNDAREVEKMIREGDEHARLVYDAMIYNIAKNIGAYSIAAKGEIDYVLLTGGIAYSKYLTEKLKEYVEFLAPVVIIPGENELQALCEGALRVLRGEEQARVY
ncbi:MAG: butyrate kinase [Negativicutes bacterium]|jgi:butyrate kinase